MSYTNKICECGRRMERSGRPGCDRCRAIEDRNYRDRWRAVGRAPREIKAGGIAAACAAWAKRERMD